MAEKIISKFFEATQIIVEQVPMIVIFCLLLITRSMIREVVPDKITIFCRSIACLSTEETQDSGIVFAPSSREFTASIRPECLSFVLKIHGTRQQLF